jgi:hypothetical protein
MEGDYYLLVIIIYLRVGKRADEGQIFSLASTHCQTRDLS